jgi:large subunit ribosomal protein L23
MKTQFDLIIQPLVTEKSAKQEAAHNEFALLVDKSMSKDQIKKAVENVFGVRPTEVRTVVFRKKSKTNRYGTIPAKSYKKAYVRLPEGKRLEMK